MFPILAIEYDISLYKLPGHVSTSFDFFFYFICSLIYYLLIYLLNTYHISQTIPP